MAYYNPFMSEPSPEIYVNPESRGVYFNEDLERLLPKVLSVTEAVRHSAEADPATYVWSLASSVGHISAPGWQGENVPYSLFYDSRSDRATDMSMVFAPLSDSAPQ